jgi:hypothetical protein
MGLYKDREEYIKAFAEGHALVQHDVTISGSDKRRSFFRINDEAELNASCINWVHFPCMVMIGLSGGFADKGGSIRLRNTNTLMFLSQPSGEVEATAITTAYDQSFGVLMDFVKAVYDDFEDDPSCGTFKDINLNQFTYEQVGPIADKLYGWILSFNDEIKTGF